MGVLFKNHSKVFSSEKEVEWWNAVINSINDGILVIDRQGLVKLINPEYTRITGVSSEILGKPLREYHPSAQLPDTLEDKKCRIGVYRKTENREYMVDMAPIIVNDEVIGAVSVCKSLTEVHRFSQELKKQSEKLKQLERQMGSLYEAKYTFEQIIGKHTGLKGVFYAAENVTESDLPILITGESGTGKELFSQAIHNKSDRKDQPFISVNCTAIHSTLLESELFGYGEGAFTNVKKCVKAGLFEIANHGTIFLDEICNMSYDLQAKLLKVLQERKIRRVGEMIERDIDVRVIAATHRDLHHLVNKNQFFRPLFDRLNVIRLQIPPLRERTEDIPDLVYSLIQSAITHSPTDSSMYTIDEQTLRFLQSYEWSGNVRELKNVINYAICMVEGTEIKIHHLPELMMKQEKNLLKLDQKQSVQTLHEVIEETEQKFIQETLSKFGNDIKEKREAAKTLGVSLATLYNKIKKYNINV